MFDNNIYTSVTTVTITKWSDWDEKWEDIDSLELKMNFCTQTFLNELTDEEIRDIIGQDELDYTLSKITIERPENGGVTIKGYTADKYYSDEPYEALVLFKQCVLNGITLYMMTKVVL